VCGENPTVTELIDYQMFCGINPQTERGETDRDISPVELKSRIEQGEPLVLVDVREQGEWDLVRLPGARHIPVNNITERAGELSTADEIVLYCKSGVGAGAQYTEATWLPQVVEPERRHKRLGRGR
jgi:adenylyltransferase/sulfurtransferase